MTQVGTIIFKTAKTLLCTAALGYAVMLSGCVGSIANPSPEQIRAQEILVRSPSIHCTTFTGPPVGAMQFSHTTCR
jgi:hypothetical protein